MENNLKDKITSELKELSNEIGKFVSQLIQFNTENPVNSSEIQNFIKEKLNDFGARTTIHTLNHNAVPLTSSLGRMDSHNFILYGHGDVVPAGDLGRWKFPPYSGKIVGDKIWGRGAADMKGGLAAALFVFGLLTQYNADDYLSNGVSFVSVLDEEHWAPTPSGWGTSEWLLRTGKLKGEACIMGEQSSINRIVIGERGDYWVKLACNSRPRHGSAPVFEENPNIVLFKVLNDIYDNIKDMKVEPPEEIKEVLSKSYLFIEEDLKQSKSKGIEEEIKKMMSTPSMNVGKVKGGTMINLVPDKSEAELAFCIPVGMKKEVLHKVVSGVVSRYKNEKVVLEPMASGSSSPTYTCPSSPLIKATRKAAKEILHHNIPMYITQGTSDANIYRARGIDTVFYGPGNFYLSHTYNEWVSLNDIMKIAQIYLNTIFEYDAFTSKSKEN